MSQINSYSHSSNPGTGTVTSVSGGVGITITGNPTIDPTVNLTVPVVIANGGTNATSFTNTDGVIYFNGTRLVTTNTGTNGQILSISGGIPTFVANSGGTITLNGDVGSATGDPITITGGSSGAIFTGSGSTLTESFNFLALPSTTINATQGYISFGGNRWISNYGTGNTFVGQGSGNASLTIVSSLNNTGLGSATLLRLTTGENNVAIGFESLINTTSGSGNTTVGTDSCLSMNGTNNSALGFNTASDMSGGSTNLFLGYNSGNNYVANESSNILLLNTGTTSENNAIHIGTQGSGTGQQNTCFIAGITGSTVSNPATVVINTATGQLGIGAGSGNPIETITGDSGGALSPTAGNITITGGSSGAIFTGSGSTLTESFNFLVLPSTTGGGTAGYINLGTTRFAHDFGVGNAFIGSSAGNYTLSGIDNTGLGASALTSLTSGAGNTAVGNTSLTSLTTGSNNTACGVTSLSVATSSSFNTGVGYLTLSNVSTGSGLNTAIGYSVATGLATGASNVLIGSNAASTYTTSESSNIIISNSGVIGDNNTIRIGTQGASTGQQNEAFIAGIVGVSPANPTFTTINSSTGQLGVSQGLSTTAAGLVTNTKQSAFSYWLTATASNVTGDGTVYIVPFDTAFFDQNSDFNTGTSTFTAPVTGKYFLQMAVLYTGVVAQTTMQMRIVTTSNNYNVGYISGVGVVAAGGFLGQNGAIFAPMTAGDTAQFQVVASGSIKTVGLDSAPSFTYMSGYLVC